VAQPIALERRSALLRHRLEADVERVRGQARGDRHVEVGHPRAAPRDGGERLDEPGLPRHHLEDELGQIDARQHRGDCPA
jgi:hypothetical protein